MIYSALGYKSPEQYEQLSYKQVVWLLILSVFLLQDHYGYVLLIRGDGMIIFAPGFEKEDIIKVGATLYGTLLPL